MEADFSGYATKAGLKCSDGRTIMPNAFQHQDKMQVPLVWQHGHKDPENVLGHAILENRKDGVYCYGFFNKSKKAEHAKELLHNKDINMLSIWANQLVERSKRVLHGAIREVSLVLSGANPGALIDYVTIRHSDGDEETLDDEAIIFTGLSLEHSDGIAFDLEEDEEDDEKTKVTHADSSGGDKTVQDVYDSMTDEQKQVCHFLIGEALASSGDGSVAQSDIDDELGEDASFQDIYDSMSEKQTKLLHTMLDEALTKDDDTKGDTVKHNVFEDQKDEGGKPAQVHLSHDDMEAILADATKSGSLKEAVENYALSHGIEDIDVLFPEAKTVDNTPELFARRMEWVQVLLAGVKKSPFTRIKTVSGDLTVAEARAKGYIKGTLKKEEFFRVTKRITTPTTVYKKQKLDRDDMIDITDFDVVAWLKGEMRLMLDEELARAILVGDGRAVDDDDKINEDNIRPIASDHEVYTTTINVNLDDSNSSIQEAMDAIILNRKDLRGTGLPTLFTTETYIAKFLLLRDTTGRKIYKSIDEVASDLRLEAIVSVPILEEYPDIVGILVNLADYVVGADKGGQVSLFDFFDIDYNQYKYLIEVRASGALTKLKSAMVVRKVDGSATLVTPAAPAFDGDEITITDQTGVVYRNADTDAVMNNAGSPYAVADGETVNVHADPDTGYYFASSDVDDWSFTGTP